MNLTVKIKLLPAKDQARKLLKTMEAFNEACNFVSKIAFEKKMWWRTALHYETYYQIRGEFNLSAQMAVRVIDKVSQSYKGHRKQLRVFKRYGAIIYDKRILTIKTLDEISILTLDGRLRMPIVIGQYAKLPKKRVKGQADLIYQDGKFYLCVVVDIPEPPETKPDDFMGVDLGIVNIAVDSYGKIYTGAQVNGLRKRHAKLRAKLQSKGTKSAKRLLKKRRRKEKRFASNVNHVISKDIVARAKDSVCGIALESLKDIRKRITVRKAQRRQQHSWSFFDLQQKILYKAKQVGIPVVFVDPKNTSRECPVCGYIAKSNRKAQSVFSCKSCNFSALADFVAALNIRGRALVNAPHVEAPSRGYLQATGCASGS